MLIGLRKPRKGLRVRAGLVCEFERSWTSHRTNIAETAAHSATLGRLEVPV